MMMFENDAEALDEDSTLTEWEWVGLKQIWNLADGHSHFRLPPPDRSAQSMGEIFGQVEPRAQELYEREFVAAFFAQSGQTVPSLRPMLHYSCSTSIDLVSKAMGACGVSRVGVLTPTFDNVAQLLNRAHLQLVPIPESEVMPVHSSTPDWFDRCDALFLVFPNNPTGWMLTEDETGRLFRLMATHKKAVVVDYSFRFYSELHEWDQYALAAQIDALDWIFIEDTGKTWPLAEMKLGVASASPRFYYSLLDVTGELLLNVSPFVVRLLTQLLRVTGDGLPGVCHARQLVAQNREVLKSTVGASRLEVVNADSLISVEWLRLKSEEGISYVERLLHRGLAVLPGAPFFWNDRALGSRYLRVALARDSQYFEDAMRVLSDSLADDELE